MKFYRFLVLAGFIFWISESAYFGWNEKPINVFERWADIASQIMLWWGIIGDLLTNIKIEKSETNNINTKNVNINGKPVIKFGEDKKC